MKPALPKKPPIAWRDATQVGKKTPGESVHVMEPG
jgi:hypothetical protein